MFTGIVEGTGEVRRVAPAEGGLSLELSLPLSFDDLRPGDSVSVNGVCLTAKSIAKGSFSADVSGETVRKTTFSRLKVNDRVNLERALRLSDRLGGHIVSGHVDGTATVAERRREGESVVLSFSMKKDLTRYLIEKGSVALDGISLTVNKVWDDGFSVNIIPHTAAQTTILDRKTGEAVNVELDIIGKYVDRLLGNRKSEGISEDFLKEHGFLR